MIVEYNDTIIGRIESHFDEELGEYLFGIVYDPNSSRPYEIIGADTIEEMIEEMQSVYKNRVKR